MSLAHIIPVIRKFAPPALAALDPLNKASTITLSENNLRSTRDTGFTAATSRSFNSRKSGKVYFEFTVIDIASTDTCFGLAPSNFPLTNQRVGFDNTNSLGFLNGSFVSNAFGTGSVFVSSGIGAFADGDTLDIAYDFATKKAWGRRNNGQWCGNNSLNNPTSGLGGFTAAANVPAELFVTFNVMTGPETARVRLSVGTMLNTIPSGFTAWATTPIQAVRTQSISVIIVP